MSEKTHLVIGLGEVGSSLLEVLKAGGLPAEGRDVKPVELKLGPTYDFLHICLPHQIGDFAAVVRQNEKQYRRDGGITVVHSTVPLGTTATLGDDAVHSPIRGVHPKLAEGIRTFVKFFGGPRAAEAAAPFAAIGIRTQTAAKAGDTEALKLWDTTYYAWCVVFEKALHQYCEENGLDFDIVYRQANESYNEGYATLGRPEVRRPVLRHVPGPIGGHCLLPNARLLDHWIGDLILERNGQPKRES